MLQTNQISQGPKVDEGSSLVQESVRFLLARSPSEVILDLSIVTSVALASVVFIRTNIHTADGLEDPPPVSPILSPRLLSVLSLVHLTERLTAMPAKSHAKASEGSCFLTLTSRQISLLSQSQTVVAVL